MPVLLSCDNCGAQVRKKPSHVLPHNYCSRSCSSIGLRKLTMIKRKKECKYCNKAFYPEHKNQKYCSEPCRHAARAYLDYSKSFLTQETKEWLDGFMLGDGHISPGGELTWSLKYTEFSEYLCKIFEKYNCTNRCKYQKDDRIKSGGLWTNAGQSHRHPDLKEQRKRWYPESIKIVPQDICFSPKTVLMWYLGDGVKANRTGVEFCTESFTKEDCLFLINKFKGIKIIAHYRYKKERGGRIKIKLDSIKPFLDYVGWESPVECYWYKFNFPKIMKNNKQTSQIAEESRIKHHEIWRFGKQLFSSKEKGINGSIWWSRDEEKAILDKINSVTC